MLKDAELHAEEDKKRKDEVEVRNEADSLAFRATKALDEYKDKLPKDIVDNVQSKIEGVKKALEGTDIERIKTAKQELESHMQHIGEAMAKAGATAQPGAGAEHAGQAGGGAGFAGGQEHQSHQQQPKGGDDDIEEADVEIIDDNKK